MKENKVIIIIVLCLISLLLGISFWAGRKTVEQKDQDPAKKIVQYVEDKHKIDSVQGIADRWRSDFLAAQDKITRFANHRHAYENATQKAIECADSLDALISDNDTLCKMAIRAKNMVILMKDSTIALLDTETREYSRQVYRLQMASEQDSIVIAKLKTTNENLACAYNWKVKHKFWAWVMGWKCR